ncbi:poly-gamma-glutamate biosynthesis protein PgsC/CapC [Halostagnicola kamekurae]|uniref:Capsule biosynthesis CapC n=1 Tax=Halostagnicola kamekurae TaxID=619731 RepID=A0A1I6NYW8_9EURY|nr:poly-gamma-glutamate biosynthesis protein PgsC/CapC [Halostagnicola kamekurae]SFS33163.1 Capsule biosynthesis CapC [Halostagnicola kamekurae]
MIVASLVMIVGLLVGIGVVQAYGLRLSGVLVVPMYAVYALYDVLALPAFVIGVAAAYVGLAVLQRRTLLFGRQLLLAGMILSMVVPLAVFGGLLALGVLEVSLTTATFAGSILPGVAAYNYHQLDSDRRLEDVAASVGTLVGLIALGGSLVNLAMAPRLGRLTPPVLYGPNSDIAAARNAVIADMGGFLEISLPIVLLVIALGMLVSEGSYVRWGIRLNGIIALPLLALFALQSIAIIPLYVLGVAAVYGILKQFHRSTLLYGRVLLGTGLVIALAGSIPIAVFFPVASGLHLFFTAILIGIAAYNLHRMPPEHRSTSISLSTGAFALFLGGLRLVVTPEPGGALTADLSALPQIALLVACVVVGAVSALRLERLRPARSSADRQSAGTHT